MKSISGGITRPLGFSASGICCGIKRSSKRDLGLIFSKVPCATAAVFTKNSMKAAPVLVSQKHVRNHKTQAIVVNSGNANCFTGEMGLNYAQKTTEVIADLLGIASTDVLVMSTGIIGKPLPFAKIKSASPYLVAGLDSKGASLFEEAILTTDLVTKSKTVQIGIGGKKVIIAGCAKGSGMIEPNMATMLAYVTTDANIEPKLLQKMLKEVNEETFNAITVDGCMSTNDSVTVMANGLAENKIINATGRNYSKLKDALMEVCLDLAKKIVLDGEGATKFITINVKGAKSDKQAKKVAKKIANSNLVKTAAYASDPNWGRLVAAIGSAETKANEENVGIKFSSFKKKNISVDVDLKLGKACATVYTCDLSYEYVRINGEYN